MGKRWRSVRSDQDGLHFLCKSRVFRPRGDTRVEPEEEILALVVMGDPVMAKVYRDGEYTRYEWWECIEDETHERASDTPELYRG